MTTIRQMLENKYLKARGTTKYAHLSDIELCFGIIADDADATRDFAELYRGWLTGHNHKNPINLIAEKYEIYTKAVQSDVSTEFRGSFGSPFGVRTN